MESIALVVLDTLRKDTFDEHFEWLDGMRYKNAYATANWTGPVHASLFTGEYGSTVGVSSKSRRLDCQREVLPEQLQHAGYTTRGWSANPNVSPMTDFDRGFTEFEGPSQLTNPDARILDFEKELSEREFPTKYHRYSYFIYKTLVSDCDTLPTLKYGFKSVTGIGGKDLPHGGAAKILERIRSTSFGRNEFAFINLMETHTPYYPPEKYRDFDDPVDMAFGEAYFGVNDPDLVREGYDSAAAYLSDIYQDIFNELSKSFDYIITVSDHGELLGEYGMWNHVSGIYPELTHVPLVISGPDLSGEREEPTSLLHVYETLVDLAGLESSTVEESLLEGGSGDGVYIAEYRGPFAESLERAEREGLDLDQFDRDLFALISSKYYGYENYDGWQELGDTDINNPQQKLHEMVAANGMQNIDEDKMDLDGDTREQLSNLGYM